MNQSVYHRLKISESLLDNTEPYIQRFMCKASKVHGRGWSTGRHHYHQAFMNSRPALHTIIKGCLCSIGKDLLPGAKHCSISVCLFPFTIRCAKRHLPPFLRQPLVLPPLPIQFPTCCAWEPSKPVTALAKLRKNLSNQ